MSLVLSVAEMLLAPTDRLFSWGGYEVMLDSVILYSLSLLCYIPVAVIVGAVHLFERRSNWLPTLFIWLVSAFYFYKINKEYLKMNEETKYELVKFIDNELELEVSVSPKEETVWMTQAEIAELFGKDRKTITNLYKNEENQKPVY